MTFLTANLELMNLLNIGKPVFDEAVIFYVMANTIKNSPGTNNIVRFYHLIRQKYMDRVSGRP